jgi:hypothetical protein
MCVNGAYDLDGGSCAEQTCATRGRPAKKLPTFACSPYDRMHALMDGRVVPEGMDFNLPAGGGGDGSGANEASGV